MLLFPLSIAASPETIHWTQWIANAAVAASALFAAFQYRHNSQLKAAETLLKIEEEFREVSGTFLEIEYDHLYTSEIAPALQSALDPATYPFGNSTQKKLLEIDRCLRFLYLCSVLNRTLRADHVAGDDRGVVPEAYYYYIGILLREEVEKRSALDRYTSQYYPRLRTWVDDHQFELRATRAKRSLHSAKT